MSLRQRAVTIAAKFRSREKAYPLARQAQLIDLARPLTWQGHLNFFVK